MVGYWPHNRRGIVLEAVCNPRPKTAKAMKPHTPPIQKDRSLNPIELKTKRVTPQTISTPPPRVIFFREVYGIKKPGGERFRDALEFPSASVESSQACPAKLGV